MIRLLLDQGLAPLTAELLRAEGFDARHVSAIGMYDADDAAILDVARAEDAVCVTFDGDDGRTEAIGGIPPRSGAGR